MLSGYVYKGRPQQPDIDFEVLVSSETEHHDIFHSH